MGGRGGMLLPALGLDGDRLRFLGGSVGVQADKVLRQVMNGVKFTEREVSEKLGIPLSTLRRWRYDADKPGPRWIKVGNAVRYPEAWVLEYLARCQSKAG